MNETAALITAIRNHAAARKAHAVTKSNRRVEAARIVMNSEGYQTCKNDRERDAYIVWHTTLERTLEVNAESALIDAEAARDIAELQYEEAIAAEDDTLVRGMETTPEKQLS